MSDNSFPKQPKEVFTIEFDFTERLATAETITSKTVSAIELKHNKSATSAVINSSTIAPLAKSVYVKVKNGIDGVNYKITVVVGTSGSNTLENDVIMEVYDV